MKTIRLLSIGNSFSEDAQEFLAPILRACGYTNIILGNLYIGGASLVVHVDNWKNKLSSYDYFKNISGEWTKKVNTSLLEGVIDEPWDFITLQQASGYSGFPDSYEPYLSELLKVVRMHATNPKLKLLWHMTWAYQQDSNHPHFSFYGHNQDQMIEQIHNTVQQIILPRTDFWRIIPSGTTIQLLRKGVWGDTLTRDGFHLSLERGRLAAAMTFAATLCPSKLASMELDSLPFNKEDLIQIRIASQHSYKYPFVLKETKKK